MTKLACVVLAVFGWLVAARHCASIARCPDSELLSRYCICRTNEQMNLRGVECSEIPDVDVLDGILGDVGDDVNALVVNASSLEHFPPPALSNTSIRMVGLFNCHVPSTPLAGTSAPKVDYLVMINSSYAQQQGVGFFDALPNVKTLTLWNSTVRAGEEGGVGPRFHAEVENLFLMESNLSDVGQLRLQEMSKLVYLKIVRSKLRTVRREELPMQRMERLELENNRIGSLPEGFFADAPLLTTVGLDGNALSTLPEQVFSDLWKPTVTVRLSDNPIKCDRRLCWSVVSEQKPQLLQGKCAHPKILFGKHLRDLTVEDLNCP